MAPKPQIVTTTNTNITQPDPTTSAWRAAVTPTLIDQAGKVPDVYGSTYVPAFLPDGVTRNPDPNAGRYIRNADPLTAGPGAGTLAAQARVNATDVTPWMNKADAGYDSARDVDIAGAGLGDFSNAGGYFDQAAAGQSGAAGQGQFDAATGLYNQAAGVDTASQFQPYGAQAGGLYGASTTPLGLSAASPYLQAAGGTTPGNIDAYMNPYNRQVTDRIAELGTRNMSENLLPALSDDFVRAGGYGGTRQRDLMGRVVRDTGESILGQQAGVLQQGYGQAGQQYATDAARFGQLGATAGGLGTSQQQIMQGAGQGLAGIGSTYAGLSSADASRQLSAGQGLAGIGQTNIQASQADLARQLAAGQGQLDIGKAKTDAASADAKNKMDYGTAMEGFATTGQNNSLNLANAQDALGKDEEARGNSGIDAEIRRTTTGNTAIINQVGAAGNALTSGGQGGGTTSGTQVQTGPGPSTLGTIAGGAATALGAYNAFKAKGGPIKKKSLARASYGKMPRQGLGMFARAS